MEIDVRTLDERPDGQRHAGGDGGGPDGPRGDAGGGGGEIVTPEITSRHVIVPAEGHQGETVEVRAGGEYLFTATVSRGGEIQVSRGSAIAEELEAAIDRGRQITVAPQ
jgi:ATPase